MKIIKNFFRLIGKFFVKLDRDNIGAFAAQSAFFFVLSIFPMFMLILSLIKYTPLTENHLIRFFNELLPAALANSFNTVISETYDKSNFALVSFAAITTLWTASKGVASITFGFKNVCRQENEKRNYFVIRFLSTVYTLIFIFAFIMSLTVLVFGNSLVKIFSQKSDILYAISTALLEHRVILISLTLTLIFCGIYIISSPRKTSLISQMPGAVFSAFGWIGFSNLFAYYVENYNNYSYIYGSITTIILLMVWFYICIYILFLGLEINIFFRNYFSRLKRKAMEKFTNR